MSDTDDLKATIKAALKVLDEDNATLTNHADRYHFAVPGILFGIMGQLERIADGLSPKGEEANNAFVAGYQAAERYFESLDTDAQLDQPLDLGGDPDGG